MKHKFISIATIVVLILFLLSFRPIGACRLLNGEFEETWMKRGNILLSSLQQRSVRSPGNGCNWTGNGGNRCVGSRKAARRHNDATTSPPPPPPQALVQLREATS
ncbi:hypothetical protein L1887_21416 [Cichorium endivia]|nr:hypothetical protein L1887_21416 [Cichorium endivia]